MSDDSGIGSGPSEFGRWLYAIRRRNGLSVDELSDTSGVSVPQIYNIESGRSQNPQDRTRNKLISALNEEPEEGVVEATEDAATIENVGEFVDFDPHDENDLPKDPGIYVFYDISERPIYVGQSKNIESRIKNDHFTRFWFKVPIVQSGSYVKIEDEQHRIQIEKILIKFLKSNAVVNKQHVERNA